MADAGMEGLSRNGRDPVFAFLTVSLGRPEGATIAHMRMANELHRRGFKVVIYWLMETNKGLVDPSIKQRHVVHGVRYAGRFRKRALDWVFRGTAVGKGRFSRFVADNFPNIQRRVMGRVLKMLMDPEAGDPGLVSRLERYIIEDGVTHVLPQGTVLDTLLAAVNARGRARLSRLLTVVGDELAMRAYADKEYEPIVIARLKKTIEAAEVAPITVSRGYGDYYAALVGIDPAALHVIHPPIPPASATANGRERLARLIPGRRDDKPLVAFVGRLDCEKGIDLLLYALRLLQSRGHDFDAAFFGAPVWSSHYAAACKLLTRHLEIPVVFPGPIGGQDRDALYANSRCIIYPSIHAEAFGMVAAEAMSFGTPAVVPDRGGLPEAISDGQRTGGLTFRAWDSGHLADQIERLLVDDELHARLSVEARPLAARLATPNIVDQTLDHWGLPRQPQATAGTRG